MVELGEEVGAGDGFDDGAAEEAGGKAYDLAVAYDEVGGAVGFVELAVFLEVHEVVDVGGEE